ncbi:MAG: peptidase U32 family protein [Bacillota bacterium]
MKQPELLAPAGNLEKLEIAFTYGADAAYIGGENFSLRAGAGNFSIEEIERGMEIAHKMDKRLYVAVNIFAHNRDLDQLPGFFVKLAAIGVHGVIVSDPGIMRIVRSVAPSLPLHLSTQANCTNLESGRFWEDQGVERIILARELSLGEIKEIRNGLSIHLEAFVHGAMCVSYSGRCLLSSFLTGRSANRGDCSHPCRWEYQLVEQKRPGEFYPIIEEDRGTFILNANDMCMIEHIPELIEAGIDSLKIEGRMKSVHYVATVVKNYREAIDSFLEDPDNWQCRPQWLEELKKVSHRAYSTGFYFNKPSADDQTYDSSGYIRTHEFVGKVLEYDSTTKRALIEQRNKFSIGDIVEIFGPSQDPFQQKVDKIVDSEGNLLEAASHPKQLVIIPVQQPVAKDYLLRKPL